MDIANAITPPPIECPYCGKPLKRTSVMVGNVSYHPTCWASCGCAESRRVWEKPPTRADKALDRARVPSLFRGMAHPDAPRLADAMEEGEWVYVQGSYGTRKTELACCIVEELVSNRHAHAMFSTAAELVKARIDAPDLWNRARCIDFLAIDDLGKEGTSEYSVAAMWELVDARYSASKATAFTANYSRGDLLGLYARHGEAKTAEAIASRLQLCRCITTTGEDVRQRGGAR